MKLFLCNTLLLAGLVVIAGSLYFLLMSFVGDGGDSRLVWVFGVLNGLIAIAVGEILRKVSGLDA